ncbi:Predicted arabinose efflux permease, MFS family [Cyclobacterium lianum]|uniref:Predicted arabinose efflux permease, MFS family n=1 Tax=Cyclobacterium lianum TaxID=388280 RepID=A0A1M7L4C8_9BACT|nr:MFS transporter [Cyclobacterium lianum]SHM72639.1 Predicted arabinose efflux permease, MFS family [Cyclobacterium lianum]
MNYWNFVLENRKLLAFGLLMTCLSGYGQTYLLALYVPYLIEEFSLQNAQISVYYMIATIASAFLLPQVGKYIDKVSLKKYTLVSTLIFLLALILMSYNVHWYLLPVAFFGLRIAGQGLFSHIAITSMSKYFFKGRGKAISLASLGHPLGQAALPILVVALINLVGWRQSLLVNAAIVIIMVPVYLYFFIDEKKLVVHEESTPSGDDSPKKEVSQWEIMKSGTFWLLAPNLFVLSFTVTGLFFYQFAIAEFKGWTLEWMAVGLTFYAVAGSLAILFAGPLIDRYTARKFFPFYLIPFLAAILCIWLLNDQLVIFPYMILMGASAGFGNAIMSALQVELFGATYIGKVRSIFASIMVLSSAVGPAVYGVVVDAGYGFDIIFIGSSLLMLLVIVQSFRIIPVYTYAKMKYRFKKRHRRFDFFNVFNLKH